MAGNAVIGALRVVIGADSAALDKGLKSANSALGAFANNVATIAAGIGLERIFERVGAAIGETIKHAFKLGDELNKASQKIGIPIEQLSALKYAAELADVSFESLTKGLAKFNRGIVDAGRGQGQALEAFAAMGIKIRDSNGNLKDTSTLLGEVANKFASYKDSAEKTALAIALFGRAGADLIPLLNQGKAGIEAAAEEARRFGLIIDANAGDKVEKFNDNLKRLSAIWQGIFIKAMTQSIGVLEEVSAALVRFGNNLDLRPIWQSVATTIKEAIAVGYFFVTVIQRIGAEWRALVNIFKASDEGRMAAQQMFIKEGETTMEVFRNLGKNTKEFIDHLANVATGIAKTGEAGKNAAPGLGNVAEGMNKVKGFIEGILKQTAGFKAQVDAYGQVGIAADTLRIVYEGVAVSGIKNAAAQEALRQKLMGVAEAHARAKLAADAAKTATDDVAPYEKFNNTMRDLNLLLEKNDINWAIYSKNVQKAQRELVQADPYIQAFGNSLTTAFDSAIQGGKKLSEVLQQLLKDLARALANAAFKQLLFGGQGQGSGILGALFSGGSGLAFASGGSFAVGGAGGIDSQLVAFHASPNEQVTVTKPGQTMGGGMVFNYAPVIDARGADAAAVARLAKNQQDMANTLRPTIRDEFNRYRNQVPGV